MGASGWSYFTRWQRDVGAALRALQAQESASAGVGEELEALLEASEEGTHSILDIMGGVSEKVYDEQESMDVATAFAAPEAWLREAYGTTRPSRHMVETLGFDPAERLERWTAVYFPVWDRENDPDEPQWWHFERCSGD